MLGPLLKPEIEELVQGRELAALRSLLVEWDAAEVAGLIDLLPPGDDVVVFRLLPRKLAASVFEDLPPEKQRELVAVLAQEGKRLAHLLNDLSPDDRTAFLEELPGPVARQLMQLLAPDERRIALTLLGYPDESIGRLMTPDYVAVHPDWSVEHALGHIRAYGRDSETLNVIYVVDAAGVLIDDLGIREILLASLEASIDQLLDHRFVALRAADDREVAVEAFRTYDRVALPVTDTGGVLLGIVTVDDVLDVAEEEATEDIQMIGGSEALEEPYLGVSFGKMIRKRAPWLVLLFFGQLLTATAMGYFEDELAQALVLAIFIPLIISSGGNAGSQAATLLIRALTTGEVRLHEWGRVLRREALTGLVIGTLLGGLGFLRVATGEWAFHSYGAFWPLIGLTVGVALLGVVLWGTLSGALLPFLLKRLGVDPAVSSTPFVATLVDVTGLVIYFTVAALLLRGAVL